LRGQNLFGILNWGWNQCWVHAQFGRLKPQVLIPVSKNQTGSGSNFENWVWNWN
jgi:hypothetical protein